MEPKMIDENEQPSEKKPFWVPPNANDDTKIYWHQDLFNCCDDLSVLTTTLFCPCVQLGISIYQGIAADALDGNGELPTCLNLNMVCLLTELRTRTR